MILTALLIALAAPIRVEAPAFAAEWQNAPARFEVDRSVYTAKVLDGYSGQEIPCKVQQHRDKRYIFWTRTDNGTQATRYEIVFNEPSSFPPPIFVGAGDMLDYGRKGVIADLGVGLWATAMPIDWDGDGDWDLLYSCGDVPQNGLYVYIQEKQGIFRRMDRIGDGYYNAALGDINADGKLDLIHGNIWFDDIRANGMSKRIENLIPPPAEKARSFMARQVDWDGDGALDLISAADIWGDYGWDQAFDATGNWTRGPLHGPLWFHKNTGTNEKPAFAEGVRLEADEKLIETYGNPCPCIADWDGDGDLDIICGEFRDEFTYFENVGTRTVPRLAPGRPLVSAGGILRVDLCMMSPQVCDWDSDGKPDLVVGQEDGRVSVFLNRGMSQGSPRFADEKFLREADPPIKSGALVTPWLEIGMGDLYCGNTAGYIEWFAWNNGEFRNGKYLKVDNQPFRIQAGYNGSIQGPAEEKWGYTVPTIGDLNGDQVAEIVYNSIIGRIEWFDRLDATGAVSPAQRVQVQWEGMPPYPAWNWWKPESNDLVVQWRTRPIVLDWDKDGHQDLVALDHEGYLALYRGATQRLQPGKRVFLNKDGSPLRLNDGAGGKSGRAKFDVADWDGDGDLDIIRNTQNAGWLENLGDAKFESRGDLPGRKLAGHTTAPQALDWNQDGKLDLIVGAEDGHIYCYHRAALDDPAKLDAVSLETAAPAQPQ